MKPTLTIICILVFTLVGIAHNIDMASSNYAFSPEGAWEEPGNEQVRELLRAQQLEDPYNTIFNSILFVENLSDVSFEHMPGMKEIIPSNYDGSDSFSVFKSIRLKKIESILKSITSSTKLDIAAFHSIDKEVFTSGCSKDEKCEFFRWERMFVITIASQKETLQEEHSEYVRSSVLLFSNLCEKSMFEKSFMMKGFLGYFDGSNEKFEWLDVSMSVDEGEMDCPPNCTAEVDEIGALLCICPKEDEPESFSRKDKTEL